MSPAAREHPTAAPEPIDELNDALRAVEDELEQRFGALSAWVDLGHEHLQLGWAKTELQIGPMAGRKDPLLGASRIVRVYATVRLTALYDALLLEEQATDAMIREAISRASAFASTLRAQPSTNGVLSPPIEIEYLEGGWIKDQHMAVCPECGEAREGTAGWHLKHERECAWKPAGTWFGKRLATELQRGQEALAPLVAIADAYDDNALDGMARKRWGKDLEHENDTPPEQIELYEGRGGKGLLTLADCLRAREAVRARP